MRRLLSVAIASITLVALTACSSGSPGDSDGDSGGEATSEVKVGLLTSFSGPLAVAGGPWSDGFKAGIDYATDGTGIIDGVKIDIVEGDDASDPNTGLAEATNMVSNGVQIIVGSASSGVGLGLADFAAENNILYISGSANSDALTGINRNTFRSTRSSTIDTNVAIELLGDRLDGAALTIIAHDVEYGKAATAAFLEGVGERPGSVEEIYAPVPDTDVSPFVQRIKDSQPDILVPFWTGDTLPWYKALKEQAVMEDGTLVVTNTATRSSWADYRAIWNDNLLVYSPWPPGAVENEQSDFLNDALPETDFHAGDGFTAALMVVHAIKESAGEANVDAWISSLEGYVFDGPRGETTVRAEDHALLAPLYLVSYETGVPVVKDTIDGDTTAPPVKKLP